MIRFPCGKCGRVFNARPELAGRTIKCPVCGTAAEVPANSVEAAVSEGARAPRATGAQGPRPTAVCGLHPNRRSVGQCAVCKAPICGECRDERGYYCSPEHQSQALEAPQINIQVAEDVDAERKARNVLLWMKRGGIAVAGVLVVWIAWRLFFVKGGSTRWETDLGSVHAAEVLGGPGAIRVVTSEGTILTFDEKGAKTSEHTMAAKPEWGGIGTPVGDLAIFGKDDDTVAVSLVDGKLAWKYPGRSPGWFTSGLVLDKETFYLTHQELSPEQQAALGKTKKVTRYKGTTTASGTEEVDVPDVDPKFQHLIGARTHLIAVDARTGKEKWKAPFEKPLHNVQLDAGAGHVIVREENWTEGAGSQSTLTVHSGADGRGLFRIDSKVELLGNPLFTPQGLVVVKATGLECLAYAGGTKVWSAPMNLGGVKKTRMMRGRSYETTERPMKNLWVVKDTILLHVGRSLICVQMADGKTRFSVDAGAWLDGVVESGGVLVCSGGTEQKLADMLKDAPPFTIGQDELTKIVSEEMPGAGTLIPVTIGLDSATGKNLWTAKVSGEFLDTGHGIALFQSGTRPDFFARLGQPGYFAHTKLHLLDAASGSIVWEREVQGRITKPLVIDRTIVFGLSDKDAPASLVAVWIR
jgi:outer membrane protein assembly factor BamB